MCRAITTLIKIIKPFLIFYSLVFRKYLFIVSIISIYHWKATNVVVLIIERKDEELKVYGAKYSDNISL